MLRLIRLVLFVATIIAFSNLNLHSQVRVQDSTVATLKEAFDLINTGVFTGSIEIKIDSNVVETERAVLVASGVGTASYTSVVIYPTAECSITGDIPTALIELRDADDVTIDGRINRTGENNALTIHNAKTVNSAVIWLNRVAAGGNGARRNTIRNCNIRGNSATATSVYGIVTGASTSLTTAAAGQDSLTIINNNFSRSGYAINVYGVTNPLTVGTVINDNNFGNNATPGDGCYYAVYVYNVTRATISNNVVCLTTSTPVYGYTLNYITLSTITNNVIRGTSTTSGIYGMYLLEPHNNIVEDYVCENNTSTYIYGVYLTFAESQPFSTTTASGLPINGSNNLNNIFVRNNSVSSTINGIYMNGITTSVNNAVIENNQTSGLTVAGWGIYFNQAANSTLTNSKIINLRAGGNAYGVGVASSANVQIKGNIIDNITSFNPTTLTYTAHGIYVAASSNNTVIANNSISGIYDGTNKLNKLYVSSGIMLYASTGHKVYYNSVNLHGNSLGSNNAPGYSSAISFGTAVRNCNIRNNSFVNTMLKGTDNSKSLAVHMAVPANWTGMTMDNNNYFVSGSHGVLARIDLTDYTSLSAFQSSSPNQSQDANSMNLDPIYNSANNLNPFIGSPLLGQAVPIVGYTTDLLGATRSTTAPTIGAYELEGDFVAPTINFIPLNNTTSVANRPFSAVILDKQAVDETNYSPRIYYRKSTNANTFAGNTASADGWKYSEGVKAGDVFNFTIDYSLLGGVAPGTQIEYFVVAQDIASTPNATHTPAEFTTEPTSVVLTAENFPIEVIETEYSISLALLGTIQVGQGKAYTSLTNKDGFFEALKKAVVTGDLNVEITSDIAEKGEFALEQYTTEGGAWGITIYPTGNYKLFGDNFPALVELSDADRVTIDGRINKTGNQIGLTIENRGISGATVWLNRSTTSNANGAKNNTIKYCRIIAGSPTTNNSYGIVISGKLSLDGEAAGNDGNTIEHNEIYRAYHGIKVSGGVDIGGYTQSLLIRNNNFGNNATVGDGLYYSINLRNVENCIIDNNTFKVNSSTFAHFIYNSYSEGTIIKNNKINENEVSSAMYGIYDHYSNASQIFNNEISDNAAAAAMFMINVSYSTNSNVYDNAANYNISSSTMYLCYSANSENTLISNNQFIGNKTTYTNYGINATSSPNVEIRNNTVADITGGLDTYGIFVNSTAAAASTNPIIENNKLQNILSTSNSAINCSGIYISPYTTNAKIVNNAISGIMSEYGTENVDYIPAGIKIKGSGGHKIYFNTVNMWGENFVTNGNKGITAALCLSDAAAKNLDIRNNVFANKVVNVEGSKSYAFIFNDEASLTGTTIDYNDYYVDGSQGMLAKLGATELQYLFDIKMATNQNASSVNLPPVFNSDRDVIPFYGSPLIQLGTALQGITTDILGTTRHQTAPTLGAYELAGDFVPPVVEVEQLKNVGFINNRQVSAVITDISGVNSSVDFAPRIYYKKKSNDNTFIDNTASTDGWKYSPAAGASPDFTFTIDVSKIYGGIATGDEIEYFVIAQDSSTNNIVGYNTGKFGVEPATVQLTAANFPVTRVKTSYKIMLSVQGTFQVGEGQQFTSLTGENGAFAFLNGHVLTGDVSLELTSDLTENGFISLRKLDSDGPNAPYHINVYPTKEVMISGNTDQALIILEGAERFSLDGRINRTGEVNALTVENYATSGAGIWLRKTLAGNSCSNITIRNINSVGASAASTNCYGITGSGYTSLTYGSHNNVSILYNNFRRSGYAIRMYGAGGTAGGSPNKTIYIRYNSLGNGAAVGDGHAYPIYLYNADNSLVSNNYISLNLPNGSVRCIHTYNVPDVMIYDNVIENCDVGSGTLYGISISTGSHGQIYNNTVRNIIAGSAYAIYVNVGNYATITDNTVKNITAASNMWALYFTGASDATILNNDIQDISSSLFYGIYGQNSARTLIENNTIRNIVASANAFSMYVTGCQLLEFNRNVVENMIGSGTICGLNASNLSRDLIFNNNIIKNLSGSNNIYAVYVYNSKAVAITNNIIDNILQTSGTTSTNSDGIYIGVTSDSSYIANNAITGIFAASNRTAASYIPSGIKLAAGARHKVYFNSVNIYGDSRATDARAGIASAFTVAAAGVTGIDVKNNIFNNSMVSPNTNFKSYATYILSPASLNSSTLDYNDYYASGANKVMAYLGTDIDSLRIWVNTSNMDQQTVSFDPSFNNNRNLAPFEGSGVTGIGTPISGISHDITGTVRSSTAPSIGAYELAGDFEPPLISFVPLSNTSEIANRTIQAEIYDLNGVNNTSNPPRIYFKKKSNQNVFIDNSPGTDGWKYTVGLGAGFSYAFTIDYNLINGGVSGGDEIEYFIIAQDNSSFELVGATSDGFNSPATSTSLDATNFPVRFINHSYRISVSFVGTIDVGNGKLYTSLTNKGGVFEVLNSGTLASDIQIRITSDLAESGTVPLLQLESVDNKNYSVTIYPTGQYTIAGSSSTATIQLKDADNVTIDGRINRSGSENALTISNDQTGAAVIWINRDEKTPGSNGAKNITIRNCKIVGPASNIMSYCINTGSSTALMTPAAGIDSLKILYNDIRRAYFGIRLYATDGNEAIAPQIVGNKFGDDGNPANGLISAIYGYYSRDARIDSNNINISASGSIYGVQLLRGFNASIQNNKFIGYSTSSGTVTGFYLSYVQSSLIANNVISNSSGGYVYGLQSSYSLGNTYENNKIENNVADFSISPIYASYGTANTFNRNIINSASSGSILSTCAIQIINESRVNIGDNTITNISGQGMTAGIAINSTSTGSPSSYANITGNRIENLNRTVQSGSSYVAGIVVGANSNNATIANNIIQGIYDMSPLTNPAYFVSGIRLAGSQNTSLYYNTINLSGHNLSAGSNYSAAMIISGSAFLGLTAKNNIFANTMTAMAGSKSYSVYVVSTGMSDISLDNNNYYAAGPYGAFGYMGGEIQNLSGWQTATLQDSNSISADPLFAGSTDLRPLDNSPLIGAGSPIQEITTDILGDSRSATAPTIGAYENSLAVGVPTLEQPANKSTNVSLTPTLTWSSATYATGYGVQVSTDANFTTFVYNGTTTGLDHTLATLNYNTQYFWRVRALKGTEQGEWSAVWSFTTEQGVATQAFSLVNGWNMISANVEPSNNDVSSIMAPLAGNLQQVKNAYGEIYAPPFTNTLTGWNKYHAYQIRMTTSAQFQLAGTPIVPEATPITLNQLGWYWLPYYRTSSMPTATTLASISGKYLQVKTITGEIYQPPFATTLANLDPNKGYMIRLIATDGTLTYPANSIIKQSTSNTPILEPKVFVRENNVTGKTAFIALDLNANEGDEVGVFTRDGMLVGSSVWQNALRGVVVWGDDEFTSEKDGASEGEELIVKVWNSTNKNIGEVSQITLSDMTTNAKEYTLRYETDAVYFLKGNVEATSNTLTVTPQPATTEVMLNLGIASEGEVEVKLFNQAGQLMLQASESAMNGIIKLNTSDLPSGVYQAMINVDGNVQTARIVIVR